MKKSIRSLKKAVKQFGNRFGSRRSLKLPKGRNPQLEKFEDRVLLSISPSVVGANEIDEGSVYEMQLSAGDDAVARWDIDWGDGTTTTGNRNGWGDDIRLNADGTWTASHVFADNMTTSVTATAYDDIDASAAYIANVSNVVSVADTAPVLTLKSSEPMKDGKTFAVILSSEDLGTDTIDGWAINWGDGQVSTGAMPETEIESQTNTALLPDYDVSRMFDKWDPETWSNLDSSLKSTDLSESQHTNDWGDGIIQITPNRWVVAHTYESDGSYNVTASASDENGTYAAFDIVGGVDRKFGRRGFARADFGDGLDAYCREMYVDDDGRIVMVGYVDDGTDRDYAIGRFNADGTVDATFYGDGTVVIDSDSLIDSGSVNIAGLEIVARGDGASTQLDNSLVTSAMFDAILHVDGVNIEADLLNASIAGVNTTATMLYGPLMPSDNLSVTNGHGVLRAGQTLVDDQNFVLTRFYDDNDGLVIDVQTDSPQEETSNLTTTSTEDGETLFSLFRAPVMAAMVSTSTSAKMYLDSDDPNSIKEGDVYTLSIEVNNLSGSETVTSLLIEWGDGTTSTGTSADWGDITQNPDGTWTATHVYDDGNYAIEVTATTTLGTVWEYHPPIPGDCNMDGVVSDIDATILAVNWGRPSGATWASGDFDGDGDVDSDDMAILSAHWLDNINSGDGQLIVDNVEPLITLSGTGSANEGDLYTLNLESNDPGDDTITVWEINWGDSSTETFTKQLDNSWTSDGSGTLTPVPGTDNQWTATHYYADNGEYTVNAKATDDDGNWDAYGPYGTLDRHFGEDPTGRDDPTGWVAEDFGAQIAWATKVIAQADGKIIAAGYAEDSSGDNADFVMARYNPDGTLDRSFGQNSNGLVVTDLGGEDYCCDMAIQPDPYYSSRDKIVLIGYSETDDDTQVALVRYTNEGILDVGNPNVLNDGFGGTDTGVILKSFAAGEDLAYGLTILPNNDIIIAGETETSTNDSDAFFARFYSDGTYDDTFNNDNGILVFAGTNNHELARSVKVLWEEEAPNNTVLVGVGDYTSVVGGDEAQTLFFFDESGATVSIGSSGVVEGNICDGSYSFDLAIDYGQPNDKTDDKLITTGNIIPTGTTDYEFGVARFESVNNPVDNFVLDSGFDIDDSTPGTNEYWVDFNSSYSASTEVVILPSGQIVSTGVAVIDGMMSFVLTGLDGSTGNLDTDFDSDGKLVLDFDGNAGYGLSICADSDGNILVAGVAAVDGHGQSVIARLYGEDAGYKVEVSNVEPTLEVTVEGMVDDQVTLKKFEPLVINGTITDPGFNNLPNGTLERFGYVISWGDGSSDTSGHISAQATNGGPGVDTVVTFEEDEHGYTETGTYTVTVSIWDDDMPYDEEVTETFDVEVVVVPELVLTGDREIDEGSQYTLGIELINPDIDPISELTIDWGDGTQTTGTSSTDWDEITFVSTNSWTAVHTYTDDGNYAIQVWADKNTDNQIWSYHPPIIGDANCDGVVGQTDLNILSFAYYKTGDWGWRDGDFSGDGNVDVADLSILGGNWGATFATADGQLTVNNVSPTLTLLGNETADTVSSYTLTLGEIVDSDQDTVSSYTIDWGDGDSDTYDAANPLPANRQVTHDYTDAHEKFTISVDVVDEDGTHEDVATKDVVVGMTLTWDPDGVTDASWGGNGTWASTDVWIDTSTNTRYTWGVDPNSVDADFSGDKVIFSGTAGTVTVDGSVSVGSIEFQTSGYTIAAGTGTPEIILVGTGGQISTGSGDQSITPILAGSVGMTKSGSGTLTLSGINTYTGDTIISAGTLKVDNTSAIPSGTGKGNVTVDGRLDLNANSITVNGLSGSGTVTSDTTGAVAFTVGGNDQSSTFDGTIANGSDTVNLIKIGTGTVAVTGANTYTGSTIIVAGTLSFDNGSLGSSGNIIFVEDSILHWYDDNTQDISSRLQIVNGKEATLDVGSNSVTLASAFGTGSSGSLRKAGTGSLNLTGSNAYTGGTTISDGTLSFNSGSLGSSGNITFAGDSTLLWNTSNAQDISSRLRIENGKVATLDIGSNNVTLATGFGLDGSGSTSSGSLDKAGSGILTLSGANIYTGDTIISAGTLKVGNANAIPSGTGKGNVTVNGTLDLNNTSITVNGLSGSGTVTSDATGVVTLTIGGNDQSSTFDGIIEDGTSGTIKLIKTGTGTVVLTNSNNDYSDGTTINAGILQAQIKAALPDYTTSNMIDVNDGGTIAVTVDGTGDWTASDINNLYSNADFDSGSALGINTTNAGTTFTYGNAIAGSLGLTKLGTGTLVLSSATNSYEGNTTIDAGALEIGNMAAIPNGGNKGDVILNADGKLDLKANNITINGLSGDGTITSGNAGAITLTVGNDNHSSTFNGVIEDGSGTIALTKMGSGILTLGDQNSYTGGTIISNGTLLLGHSDGETLDPTGDLTIHSDGTLDLGGETQTISGAVSFQGGIVQNGTIIKSGDDYDGQSGTITATLAGTAGLTKTSGGMLTLAGINTKQYTGETTVNGETQWNYGILNIEDGFDLTYTGKITVNNYGILQFTDTQSLTGTGEVLLQTEIGGGYYYGGISVGSEIESSETELTIGSNVLIHGYGIIKPHCSSDTLRNEGIIQADGAKKELAFEDDLICENAGVFSAVGGGILARNGAYYEYSYNDTDVWSEYFWGSCSVLSDSEVAISWAGFSGGDWTYTFEASIDADNNDIADEYFTIATRAGLTGDTPSTFILDGLESGTSYYLRIVATNGTATEIYDAGQVTTHEVIFPSVVEDTSGWYRVASIKLNSDTLVALHEPGRLPTITRLPHGTELTPGYSDCYIPYVEYAVPQTQGPEWLANTTVISCGATGTLPAGEDHIFDLEDSWNYASSPESAVMQAVKGLVADGSMPTVSGGVAKLWRVRYYHDVGPSGWDYYNDFYTFDKARCPTGGYSEVWRYQEYDITIITDPPPCDDPCGCNPPGPGQGLGTGPDPGPCSGLAPGSAFSTSGSTGSSKTSSNAIYSTSGCSACGTAQGGLNYNSREYWDSGFGPGWNDADEFPQLIGGSRNFVVRFGGAAAVWFDLIGDSYVARYGAQETLVHDETNDLFILTWADGSRYEFHDAEQTTSPVHPAYGLYRMVAPGGETVEVSVWTDDGKIEEVLYKTTQTGPEYQKRLFEYWDSSSDAGRRGHVKSVTLFECDGVNDYEVRIISYDYYGENESYGSTDDLKTITTQHWNGSAWMGDDTYYYRYYNSEYDAENNPGYSHSLKRVLLPNAYIAARKYGEELASPKTVNELTEEQIANFTCFYYEYDADQRVSKEVDFGQSNKYEITNTFSGYRDAYNTWHRKNEVTELDGSKYTVYSNYLGKTLLSDRYDPDTGIHTLEYNRYDDAGRLVLTTDTSGFELSGGKYYDESLPDLIGYDGDSEYLSDSDGMFRKGVYYNSTTATESTAGGVEDYLWYVQNLHGEQDSSPDTLASFEYFAHEGYIKCSNSADYATAIPSTIYPIATYSTYLDETTLITESYSYEWYTDTYLVSNDITLLAIKETTTTLPVVTAAQNGSGTSNTTKQWFDEKGNPTWSMDELGRVTYVQYDSLTGRIAKTIEDVNNTQSSSLSPPTGYEGNNNGLHIVTDYETDALGRVTQTLGPEHIADIDGTRASVRTATWTFYDDANHEIRTAQGYATQVAPSAWFNYQLVGPVSITKTDRDGRTTEQIQAVSSTTTLDAIDPLSTIAQEPFGRESYVAWTTYQYSKTRLVSSRDFHTIPTTTDLVDDCYPTGSGYSETGTWTSADGYDGDSRYTDWMSGGGTAEWTFTVDPNIDYQVFVTWQADTGNTTSAQYTVLNNTTSFGDPIVANQQHTPSDAYLLNCNWQSLGIYNATSGTLKIQLTDNSFGVRLVADAVYIVEVPDSSMYLQTDYGYENYGNSNKMGRQNKTVSPDGTITRNVLDAQGNIVETWMGTDDSFASDATPDGSAFNGTRNGDVSWSTDKPFTAGSNAHSLAFDGDGDYVEVEHQQQFDATDDMTISMWVKFDPNANRDQCLLDTCDSNGEGGIRIEADYNSGYYDIRLTIDGVTVGGSGSSYTGPISIYDNASWEFVVVQYDAGANKVRICGGTYIIPYEATFTGTPTLGSNNLILGDRADHANNVGLDGYLDDVRIYRQILTTAEIYSLYTDGQPTAQDFPAPVAHWRFEEGSGTSTSGAGYETNNMVKISSYAYDADGRTTESRSYFDDGVNDYYATLYNYDWRGRLTDVRSPANVVTHYVYDNLGRTTDTLTYADSDSDYFYFDLDGNITGTNVETAELRAKSKSLFDSLSRVYESRVYEVDQQDAANPGTVGEYLPTQTWYDARGSVVKVASGNGLFQKYAYDGLGRNIGMYTCFDTDETDYADADDVLGDTVIEQSFTGYNDAGNMHTRLTYQRLPDDTTTVGWLSSDDSYVTASVVWYDGLGRVTTTADYGREDTNSGCTHYIFDGTTGDFLDSNNNGIPNVAEAAPPIPNSSDDYIVSKTLYNSAGRAYRSIDNLGRINETQYDDLGRTIRTIQNYASGTVEETDTDQDSTVTYEYDSGGRMVTMTAYNAKGDDSDPENENVDAQATKYLYESDINGSWQTAVVYPDSSDDLTQDATTKVWTIASGDVDHVSTNYDFMGRVVTTTDQNNTSLPADQQRGVTHTYSYDFAGRLTLDAATIPAGSTSVDQDILSIKTTYDDLGRVQYVSNCSDTSGSTAVNQVEYEYNGWGRLYREYQEHNGTVDASTPFVQYYYGDGASGDVAKYVRLEEITYPDGREVHYDYNHGTDGAIDEVMSGLSAIYDDADDDDTIDPGEDIYASYKYLGRNRIVTEDYEDIEVKLDYTANNLAALDRFGRVEDQIWSDYGATPDDPLDQYSYTYDRAGNRTSRDNELHAAFDEDYTYDDLDRLTDSDRANAFDQSWGLDGLGNFATFDDDGTSQTRTANEANEITGITGGWISPTYDVAGNMISGPAPGDETTRVHYVYDAWNRLVEVRADNSGSPGTLIAEYEYDGTNRRIEKEVTAGSEHTHYYYNNDWQMFEAESVDGQGATSARDQYIWSARYVDSPIVRFHDANGDGDLLDAADNTRYYTTDANHSVTTMIDAITGTVAERYAYTPYGQATAYDANWSNPASPTEDGPLYCGYFFDAESGLFQVRNRYYDSCLSRFINRDPIGYEGSPWNLYEYVLSNPFRFIDPTGLEGGAGTISQAQLDYAKSKCTGNCGLGNPLTSIKVGMQKLGNFLIRKGATSSKESDLVDKMHDAYYKANEFATAAIKELNLKDTVRNHAALRHCFASAKYAATLGCGCAGCLGHYREEYQLLEQGQSAETTERTDWNNSMGRGVAGCMGTGNTIGNGDRFGEPHHDGPVSDDEISQGCKDMFLSGLLDLGGKTGPRRPGDPPWRKQCPKVYPVPFPRIETK